MSVAIVGAGYTGLWAAWYLKKADPGLDILVIEKDFAGFGASVTQELVDRGLRARALVHPLHDDRAIQ